MKKRVDLADSMNLYSAAEELWCTPEYIRSLVQAQRIPGAIALPITADRKHRAYIIPKDFKVLVRNELVKLNPNRLVVVPKKDWHKLLSTASPWFHKDVERRRKDREKRLAARQAKNNT